MVGRIVPMAILAAALASTWIVAEAAPTIPVRIRIIKGVRQGPPGFDPRLEDLRVQLGNLAYARWDEVQEVHHNMAFGAPVKLPLPDGDTLILTILESRRDTVTFELIVPAHRTHSRLTISKDKRIVHQLTDEKEGTTYFASIRPWP